MQKLFKPVLAAIICGSILSSIAACVCFLCLQNKFFAWVLAICAGLAFGILTFLFISKKIAQNNNINAEIPDRNTDNDVISVIAHELRSPLTTVKGYLCALNDSVIPVEQQRQYIDIAINECERTIKTLENLMSLTKFDSSSITLHIERFDINELIRLVIIEKMNSIEQKNISIDTRFSDEHIFVEADKNLIKQVVINLTDNAIKYNNVNGKINFSATSLADKKVVVEISDSGVGIPAEILPRIWDRFYQADPNDSSSYKGHGLGLCIVKEIVSAHHQEITVKSSDGAGSSFAFTLNASDNR